MLSSLDPLFLSLSRNPSLAVRGCSGLSLAALAADLADRNGGTVVLVTPDDEEALSLYRAVQFLLGEPEDPPLFLGDRRAALLWPEETSPYDHRKVFSSRLRAMENLASLYSLSQPFRPRVLVTSALRFFRRGIPKAELNAGVDFVMAGAETDRDALLLSLIHI